MRKQSVCLLAGAVVSSWSAASAAVVGSEAISRNIMDSSTGLSLIYRGPTAPFEGNGDQALTFTFYSRAGFDGRWITPFLAEVNPDGSFVVSAIGASRLSDGSGVQNFDFSAIAGSAVTEVGKAYTIGFSNIRYVADGAGGVEVVGGSENSGAIPFSGYNDFSDQWSYAMGGAIDLGTVFGTGGRVLDGFGLNGRTYSANVTFGVPAPAGLAALGLAGLAAGRRRR